MLSRSIKAIPERSGIAPARLSSMAPYNGAEAFGWTTASHHRWRHPVRPLSRYIKPRVPKDRSGTAPANSGVTAPFTGMEAGVFNMTMASRPLQRRQAQWLSKYIKAILAQSGPRWVKTSRLLEIQYLSFRAKRGIRSSPRIGGICRFLVLSAAE